MHTPTTLEPQGSAMPPQGAILTVYAGAGGTDAQDWAEMLERMYLRWCANQGYRTRVLDRQAGEGQAVLDMRVADSREQYVAGTVRGSCVHLRRVYLDFLSVDSFTGFWSTVELQASIDNKNLCVRLRVLISKGSMVCVACALCSVQCFSGLKGMCERVRACSAHRRSS